VLLLAGVAVLLIPWTAWLAVRLPSRHISPHWDVAWVGFDIALTVAIASTGFALWRCSPLTPFVATAAGTLLLVDAWFDLVNSRPGGELDWAITGAVVAELPIAALCFWLVRSWIWRRPPMEAQSRTSSAKPRPASGVPVEHLPPS
jgi:hypothetical protein